MFKIIKDETATVEQLSQGFVGIENYLSEAEAEYKDIKSELEQAFINGEPKTKANALKNQLSDCQIKKNACNTAMNQIRERIAAQLPGEAKAQIQTLETEFQTLKDEESQLYKDFFIACAKAIACREKIMGISCPFGKPA